MPTVLVVDDSEANLTLVELALRQDGLDVRTARSGELALEAFGHGGVDLVLLDIRMPGGIDGFETCRRLRELPSGQDVPVCYLTASGELDAFDHAVEAGGDDFLAKLVRLVELQLRVRGLLRLGVLTRELKATNERLRREAEWREDLLACLVHDLKNGVAGLTSVASALELLPQDSPQVPALHHALGESAWQLDRMVRDLLDVGRAEAGALPLRLEPTEVGPLVEDVVRSVLQRRLLPPDLVSLRIVDDPVSNVDPDGIRRVLENLLDNAIKYGRGHGPVEVRVHPTDSRVLVDVTDQGPGIPPDQRARLFQKYGRVGAGRSGYGLGLVSCRLLVEAHGGTISVEDGPRGQGARFRVALPLASPPG